MRTFSSRISRPDVYQYLVVQTHMDILSKSKPSTSMTHVACESKLRLMWGHPCIYAQNTGWHSDVGSCVMHGLPMHFVQELNVGTVHIRYVLTYHYSSRVAYIRQGADLSTEMTEQTVESQSPWLHYIITLRRLIQIYYARVLTYIQNSQSD